MKRFSALIVTCLSFITGCANYPELEVAGRVDLEKYSGKWYEIASFPQSFQEGCYCTTAEYILTEEDYIKVINSCRKDGVDGNLKKAEGKAFVVPNTNNAKLEVQFFWPFRGDYWIIELAEDYSYAVVGHPNREYLWILAREPKMEEKLYRELLKQVSKKGFDTTKLNRTVQECPD